VAESVEHRFLTDTTLDVLSRMSRSRLYGYKEADRRTFDFACDLERDWSRLLSGQTLWKHVEGVDKDIRTLLADNEAEVCLYVARDTTKARSILHEAVRDYRRSLDTARPWRLRVIWIPFDFDADDEEKRRAVSEILADELTRDLLLAVVLGNLQTENVDLFLRSTGIIGLDLAVLHLVAFEGFFNVSTTSETLGVSSGPVRERLVRLLGCGFLAQPDPTGSFYVVSARGRVFLELCREVLRADGHPSPELLRVLELLGIPPREQMGPAGPEASDRHAALRLRIDAAMNYWDIDLSRTDYFEYWMSNTWPPQLARPLRPEW
jgi:hypothetical protein